MSVGISALRVAADEKFGPQGEGESEAFPSLMSTTALESSVIACKAVEFSSADASLKPSRFALSHWSLCCIAVYFTYACC